MESFRLVVCNYRFMILPAALPFVAFPRFLLAHLTAIGLADPLRASLQRPLNDSGTAMFSSLLLVRDFPTALLFVQYEHALD